jgi:hypothetical protein
VDRYAGIVSHVSTVAGRSQKERCR